MKKILSIALVLLLAVSLLVLAGCDNSKGGASGDQGRNEPAPVVNEKVAKISHDHGKGVFTVSVPKNEDGTPKYEFTDTKPQGAAGGTFYLETDNAIFTFATSGLVYNTAVKYKEKYGEDTEATFQGYLDWIADADSGIKLGGMEQIKIGERDAIKYFRRTGGGGDYVYFGFNYRIAGDDIYKGSAIDLVVVYKTEEELKESKEFDQETLDIINSIVVSPKAEN